jgi:hypothetical protein
VVSFLGIIIFLLDVRNPYEAKIAAIPGTALLIPVDDERIGSTNWMRAAKWWCIAAAARAAGERFRCCVVPVFPR